MEVAAAKGFSRLHRIASRPSAQPGTRSTWTIQDTLWTAGWFLIALTLRGFLTARVEGVMDDDQSVVGLMALDIAHGRRWPIFFDGQRYMGALEAYVAAVFVKLFGHSPQTIAFAPTLAIALFVGGQYALWRVWADRGTAHLAALLASICAPMLAVWSVAPRGAYSEVLLWALPVLGIYRALVKPDRQPISTKWQFAWGFLLAIGYYLNPLALIVYITLLLDWILGRHGAEFRRERSLSGSWVKSRWAFLAWVGLALGFVSALAVFCHADLRDSKVRYVFGLDLVPETLVTKLVAAVGIFGLLGLAAWWTGALKRFNKLLLGNASAALGGLAAFGPSLFYNLRIVLGWAPRDPSLPMWIRAPWTAGVNLRDGVRALAPLVGADARAGVFSLISNPSFRLPAPVWPGLASGLVLCSPIAIVVVITLVVKAGWSERHAWQSFWSLKGAGPTFPTVLMLLGLIVTLGLYLLQATSPDSSSMRYLLPAWIFLPGLLALGLRRCAPKVRMAALCLLFGLWGAAQVNIWADMGRPAPMRALANGLVFRGVRGIVAPTAIALPVANLTAGEVGAFDFQPDWPRLRDRYIDRFPLNRPVVCVFDRPRPGKSGESGKSQVRWQDQELARRLEALARIYPARVHFAWKVDSYEIWEADLPLSEVVDIQAYPLPETGPSAKVAASR
jgi:hypothetical protein